MAKATKTSKRAPIKRAASKKKPGNKAAALKAISKPRKKAARVFPPIPDPLAAAPNATVLDRLWEVVLQRRGADPSTSHSARLMARGTPKVAQKFGEEAVECLIEAVAGNRGLFITESADVLYHLIVLWVDGGVRPEEVWTELERREGVSGIAEKANRLAETRKIP
jgi:phosphoribosyl-ATP pyrophosphohydrolase